MPRHNVDVPRQSPKREPATAARRKLREFSGSLPESYEDFPWGELVMKVNKKVFVFLGAEPGSPDAPARPGMSVKLDEYREAALAVDGAEPTHYGLGKHGWVSVPFASPGGPPVGVMADWIEESYRLVAPKRLVKLLDAGT
jgi:predicted DNA-binding protein (MmcQ/YjbR family)